MMFSVVTSAFCCVICLATALLNSACDCVRKIVSFKATSIRWICMSLSAKPLDLLLDCTHPVVLHHFSTHLASHTFSVLFLDRSIESCMPLVLPSAFHKRAKLVDLTMYLTCCPLQALFGQSPLYFRPMFLNPDSIPRAWLATLTLEAAVDQKSRLQVLCQFDWLICYIRKQIETQEGLCSISLDADTCSCFMFNLLRVSADHCGATSKHHLLIIFGGLRLLNFETLLQILHVWYPHQWWKHTYYRSAKG